MKFLNNWQFWGVLISIIIILYFSNKFLTNFSGSTGTKEIDKALGITTKDENQKQYYNDNDLKGFAYSINEMLNHGQNDIWGAISNVFQLDNTEGTVSILKQMQTTGDILKVSQYYTKTYGRNLQADLRSELYDDEIDEVNSYFDSKGIVFNI